MPKCHQMTTRSKVPGDLRLHTWNVQGLGEVARGTVTGSEILSNFTEIGEYEFFLLQEHKLLADRIPFVNKRMKADKEFWTTATCREGGPSKGGLAIPVGDRFADKNLDASVDRKNKFMWVTVATETGQMGIANIYGALTCLGRGPGFGGGCLQC